MYCKTYQKQKIPYRYCRRSLVFIAKYTKDPLYVLQTRGEKPVNRSVITGSRTGERVPVFTSSYSCLTWLVHIWRLTWLVHGCVCRVLTVTSSRTGETVLIFASSYSCLTWLVHIWRVTWLVHMCGVTHSYVWRVLSFNGSRTGEGVLIFGFLLSMCDMTRLYVWHNSFIAREKMFWCSLPPVHAWHDSSRWKVWCESPRCMLWLIHICDMLWLIHICDMCYDSFAFVTCLTFTGSRTGETVLMFASYVTWLVHNGPCDVNRSYICYDAFTYLPCVDCH